MNDNSARHSRHYDRYCERCGWGFSRRQYHSAAFCPRCGVRMELSIPHAGRAARYPKPITLKHNGRTAAMPSRRRPQGVSRPGRPPRDRFPYPAPYGPKRHDERVGDQNGIICVEPAVDRLTRLGRSANAVNLETAISFARRHPLPAAAIGGSVGASMAALGAATVSLGAGLATAGAWTAGLSALGVIGAAWAKSQNALKPCFTGIGAGLLAMLAGAALAFAGNVLMVGGAVVFAGSAALGLYGSHRLVQERRRAAIQQLPDKGPKPAVESEPKAQ
jgi:hypothetical protein